MSEIAYSVSVGEGPWQVPLWGAPRSDYWYIHNTKTGVFVQIGKVGAKRANYYDQAIEEAKRRNAEIFEKQQAAAKWLSEQEW